MRCSVGCAKYAFALRGADPATFLEEKNRVFDTTEVTRQFVKVDRIALRLGLIERALGKPEREE